MIKSKKSGQLIVISAPSGAGKDTVVKELLKRDSTNLWVSVSATSREPREGDKEGETYYFISKEEFEKRIKDGYFLEYTNYAGNYYGTPKKYIKEKLDKGIDVILIIAPLLFLIISLETILVNCIVEKRMFPKYKERFEILTGKKKEIINDNKKKKHRKDDE